MKGSETHEHTSASTPTPAEDFSLVLGGPLYQMYLRTRLLRPPADLVQRRITALALVTWLPLLVLSIASGTAFGGLKVPFLVDLEVHTRFLLSLPLLIGAEVLVYQRIRVTIRQFIDRGIVVPDDRSGFDQIIASTMRLRNSAAIEVALIVCSTTFGYWFWRENMLLPVSAGQEGNWIQTRPGKGYNVYGPLEPWHNLTWKPGDIGLVNRGRRSYPRTTIKD